jgi:acyl dehydratase
LTSIPLAPRSFGPISITDIVRYQGASGDFNPIHHDGAFARASGAPTVFSVGMLQAGFLAAYCADFYGPENVRGFRVRFHERVWPGDTVTCEGEIVEHARTDAGSYEATFRFRALCSSTVVASGEATIASLKPLV